MRIKSKNNNVLPNNVYFAMVGGLMFFTFTSAYVLTNFYSSAETKNASVTVSSACTMSTTGAGTYTDTILPGNYSEITGSPLNVVCNDASGYSIYAIGYSNDSYTGNNTKMIASLGSEYNISTATSGNNSWWAMKVAGSGTNTPTIDNSFSSYQQIPATYTKISHVTNNTTSSITTPTYKVNISGNQPAGTYTGKVKYAVVHPNNADPPFVPSPQQTDSGKICYYANASDAVGTMGCQSLEDWETEKELLAGNFSRTGYGFAGWSDAFDYDTNQNAHFYGPQETISFNAGQYTSDNPGLSLYAVWVPSAGNLQSSSTVASVCSSLTTAPASGATLASVSALTDQRDNNTYAIAKLADGNCWMIENLRLENTALENETGTLAEGYNSSFAGLATPEPLANFANVTTANSIYSTDGSTAKSITGNNLSYRFPRYNNTNTSSRASTPSTNSNTNLFGYGNYYTWSAALADTTNHSDDSVTFSGTSICPKGWKLPEGGSTVINVHNNYYLLTKAIMGQEPDKTAGGAGYGYYSDEVVNSAGKTAVLAVKSYPNNFIYSGMAYDGSILYRGQYGYYWTSTTDWGNYAYSLNGYGMTVHPANQSTEKFGGIVIRCLLDS